jgi:hypothetical protein
MEDSIPLTISRLSAKINKRHIKVEIPKKAINVFFARDSRKVS